MRAQAQRNFRQDRHCHITLGRSIVTSLMVIIVFVLPLCLDLLHETTPLVQAQETEDVYLIEKNGFTYLHLEGNPKTIGLNHGKYLSGKITRSMTAYAHLTKDRYGYTWDQCRLQALNYWYYVPQEQRSEIEGIAEGAASQGVNNPLGTKVDWLDILVLNSMWDLWWRAGALGARIDGPLGIKSEAGNDDTDLPFNGNIHHCSAFVATGSATKDGKFVIGQTLWMPFYLSPAHAVFVDIVPDNGNRILMEVTAGMIWSGTEWYLNGAGLVIGETTLGAGPYNWGKVPSFIRLRKAAQYANSIDDFKDIMLSDTNGAYCGDYLLADTKTNEVAILELGANEWELARTKDGFLGSCNYPWDPEVAAEMNAIQGWDHGSYPRYVRLDQLYEENKGNITIEKGMEILSDHYDTVEEKDSPSSYTLCGHVENASGYPWGSLDGKITNQTLASRFETWARFGHTCGQAFLVSDLKEEHPEYAFDDLVDIIPEPWCTFGPVDEVKITVRDKDGKAISGADVSIISSEDGGAITGITDENGELVIPYVMHSRYDIKATSGKLTGVERFVVQEDSELTVVVSIEEKGGSGLFSGTAGLFMILIPLILLGVAVFVVMKRKKSTVAK